MDVDPRTRQVRRYILVSEMYADYLQQTLRFLAFDCLVIDDQNVMTKTLDKRYGVRIRPFFAFPARPLANSCSVFRWALQRLKEWFYRPFARMTKEYPQMAVGQPFDIKVKDINFSYHVEKVFTMDIPNLMHGNDGLIYTCVTTPYTPGTDHNMYVPFILWGGAHTR